MLNGLARVGACGSVVRAASSVGGVLLMASVSLGQDSVASVPGTGGDAISAYDTTRQAVRYVVDLSPAASAWGNGWRVGPLAKASRDEDAGFNTLALGSIAVSPDVRSSVALTGLEALFSFWSSAGAGVGPGNASPGVLPATLLDERFGVALSDLNATSTNVVGVLVGTRAEEPNRLYVRRGLAAQSMPFAGTTDNGTLSVGTIDADGVVHLRADGFNGSGSNTLIGENIVRVDTLARGTQINGLARSGGTNIAFDAAATTYVENGASVTLNTPASLPTSLTGVPRAAVFDFAPEYRPEAGGPTRAHLAAGVEAHRGNPSLALLDRLGGVAVVSSLARSSAGGGLVDTINAFGVNPIGAVTSAVSATLPGPMPGFPTLNEAGDAEFGQYLSQVTFRGPNGLAAAGEDGEDLVLAATATDGDGDEFVAVARVAASGALVDWRVAGRVGQQVRDGLAGTVIGTIIAGEPVTFSAPAADRSGNVYFVATYDPVVGAPRAALFKATPSSGQFALERLLEEGQTLTGGNSGLPFTVDRLVLGDSDSLASGSLHAGSVLAGEATSASEPGAVRAIAVAASVTYNNAGSAESYDAVLLVRPDDLVVPACAGDANGDGRTDLDDFSELAVAFGLTVTPGSGADFDGSGVVDLDDFSILAVDFGCGA